MIQGLIVYSVNGKLPSILGSGASVRLSVTIDEDVALSITIAPANPTYLASGYAGLMNGTAGAVDMNDVAKWGPFQITAGDYSFFDDFARADADDLGAGYTEDQIGEADAPFHIKGGQFQDWVNADGTFIIAMATPADCPDNLTDTQVLMALNAFGAHGGPVFPNQIVELFARASQNTVAGASMYYAFISADQLDPTNGYVALYHLFMPDSDPNNAVYTTLIDQTNVNIPEGSVVLFDVVDV